MLGKNFNFNNFIYASLHAWETVYARIFGYDASVCRTSIRIDFGSRSKNGYMSEQYSLFNFINIKVFGKLKMA